MLETAIADCANVSGVRVDDRDVQSGARKACGHRSANRPCAPDENAISGYAHGPSSASRVSSTPARQTRLISSSGF